MLYTHSQFTINAYRELESRKAGHFEDQYVINVLDSYDGESDKEVMSELYKYKLSNYPYVIIMKQGSRNLCDIINSERLTGDFEKIRYMTSSLAKALQHLHSRNIIHADVKPKNCMRFENEVQHSFVLSMYAEPYLIFFL